ncbi:MAG: ABC-2 transporter permease [Lachnospiraceae bacterium]|nr:ABC-2 transporter permease [Lachnospiraceae bacterium]
MKGLMIKDLKLLASQKKIFIITIFVAAVFAWTSDDVTFAATYIVLLLSMMTLTTISYDEMNNGMLFLLSLPAGRKTYVKEKYVFAFLNLIFAGTLSLVVCYVFSVIKGAPLNLDDLLSNIIGITLSMAVMLAVTIPLELKYGVEKGRIAMLVAIVIVALVGTGGYKLLTNVLHVDVNGFLVSILEKLPKPGEGLEIIVMGGLFAILLLVLFISYMIANKIMKKKEF